MYTAHSFQHLVGLSGFSDTLLSNHFQLYEGYVANTNKLLDRLAATDPASPDASELRRRFGWEWNGMRMHELYFGNMTKESTTTLNAPKLAGAITEQFGSITQWEQQYRLAASSRGIGWVMLVMDPESKRLFNVWVNEHDVGIPVGSYPMVVMDVFEHAFMLDYGIKRGDYIPAFMDALDWKVAEERYCAVA